MIIDNTPAIRAFVVERIRMCKDPARDGSIIADLAVVRELEMILTLCDGLTKQNEMLTKVFKDGPRPKDYA